MSRGVHLRRARSLERNLDLKVLRDPAKPAKKITYSNYFFSLQESRRRDNNSLTTYTRYHDYLFTRNF